MKSLVQFIRESLQINEALKSSILNDICKQLKGKDGISFKELLGDEYRVRMSEVTDDDFEILTDVKFSKDMAEFLTSIIKGIIFKDKYYLAFVREPNKGEFLWFIDSDGNFRDLTGEDSDIWKVGYFSKDYKVSEKKNFIKGNDLYCLPIDKKQRDNYNKLKNDRRKAKEGSVDLSPEGLQKASEANLERYKEILANNALDKGSASDKVIDKVYDLVDDINKLARRTAKDWNKYEHEDWKTNVPTALNELIILISAKDDNYHPSYNIEKIAGEGDYRLLRNLETYAKEISKKKDEPRDEVFTHYIKKYRDNLMKSYDVCKKAYNVISSKVD